ncbi:MAG: thioredoxin-disulfide reductase [Candidatus Dadabacteria bacterium]|nr:thioredoxin-disulfide reductase [Candidatus Dadabacteria bacterium]MDE0291723.1 thioredoxin-disulfide reductase [Candidatus Dadabacteria bacterium]MDE0477046.1 thioredoxin-disulfide reductase [Candidatus Dadabacteria bacterium]
MKESYNVVIMGSGPAGLTAALYTARANLEPLVFEGPEAGGQLTTTTDVENFPGFPNGIMGPELMDLMREQSERFGAQCVQKAVTAVDFSKRPFLVSTEDEQILASTFIISSGATARMLGLPSERELVGYGVSTCATCDGFFFRDKELVVVGGGDSAMEESIFLTKFATRVTVVHRRDKLRASVIMQQRARENEKIDFIWNGVVEDVLGSREDGVTGVRIKDVVTGESYVKECQGMFVAIGHTPNSEIFKGQLEMDDNGYLITNNDTSETSVAGVFAAGDIQDTRYKQAITAAGSGCMAAMDAEKFIEEHGL